MGCRTRQGSGAADYSRIGKYRGTKAFTRQFDEQPHSTLPKIKEDIMNALGFNEQQLQKMKNQHGFVAALDQSGGSTPKALAAYGIKEGSWSNDDEMFAIVHQMRARII